MTEEQGKVSATEVLLLKTLQRANELQEQATRWANARYFLLYALILISLVVHGLIGNWITGIGKHGVPKGDYAALVRMEGTVDAEGAISAARMIPALEEAFEDDKAKGVVLVINSPGGSPVQATLIHDRISALRAQYPERKIIAVGEDMLASAAYLIATGAPEIYTARSTVTGSIGVISAQFGFPGLMERLGIERRVYTAGEHKARLDPFRPAARADVAKMQTVLDSMHGHFIDAVMSTRRSRLKAKPEEVFSGDYWTGEDALRIGLIDGIADLSTVLRKDFKVEEVRDFTPAPGILDRLAGKLAFSMRELAFGDAMTIH
jgi:protease-4